MSKVQNGEKILPKVLTPSRVHEVTDDRQMTNGFATAKNRM